MTNSKTTLVFVYGSLLRGLFNSSLLDSSELLGTAESAPKYRMYNLGLYPGVCKGGQVAIQGEVYKVDEITLANLDALEGHPDYYKRSKCVQTEWGVASMYVLPEALAVDCEQVTSGCWRDMQATF